MKCYPIGTVVKLRGGSRPLMIYGRAQKREGDAQVWDYVGCLYPEGNLGDRYNVFFQHREIQTVHYVGFISPAEEDMQKLLLSKA